MATAQHAQPKHVLSGQGKTYRARGFLCTFKLLAADTGGAFTLSEAANGPNTGVPMHIQHLEDETFIVLEGSYTFQVGAETLQCGPGEVVYVPRGVPHSLENKGSAPARMLILQAPGGIHEQYFAEAWEPIEDISNLPPEGGPPDLGKVKAAAQKHGIEMVPRPHPLIKPRSAQLGGTTSMSTPTLSTPPSTPSSPPTPEQTLHKVYSAFDQHDWTIFSSHPGLHETAQHLPNLYTAFPDLHHTIETELVQDSLVGCVATVCGTHLGPFMGIAPTGKQVSFMLVSIDRVVDGKITEHWAVPDFLGLFHQLGVTVSLSAESPATPPAKHPPD